MKKSLQQTEMTRQPKVAVPTINPSLREEDLTPVRRMEPIVVTDDELKRLEQRFGSSVRQMGPWNSDGIFGYSSVPVFAVEKAADALGDPGLMAAIPGLKQTAERTKLFIELLETFGPALIEKIAAAYRECSLELITGVRHLKPPQQETGRVSMVRAAG